MIKDTRQKIAELIDKRIGVHDFHLDGIKLGNTSENIPLIEIVEMSLSNQNDGKFIENSSNFTYHERIQMLQNHNGFVHLAGGLGVYIKNRKIDQIRITKRYLEDFSTIDKNQIEKTFGKPDYELIDDTMMGVTIYDYTIDSYISVYDNLYLFFDPKNQLLTGITLGQLEEKYYTKKTINS